MIDNRELNALADRCVKCGMCLQVCPTYRLRRQEAESPRGRIALLQAMLNGQLPTSPGLVTHLDNCLQCRACEAICPSKVPYGRLITATQERLRDHKPRPAMLQSFWRLFDTLLAREQAGALVRSLFWLYRKVFVAGGPALAVTTRPAGTAAQAADAPPLRLFTGCLNKVLDPTLAPAAQRVLEALGFAVTPQVQTLCCGALHHREGLAEQAEAQLQRSRQALQGATPVVSLVSACSLHLREQAPEVPVGDFTSFVQQHWPADLVPRGFDGAVWVHEACSLRNGLKEHAQLTALLRRVPGIDLRPLGDNRLCCGAAGTHLLSHRDQAAQILAQKLAGLGPKDRGVLITTNTGCASHLHSGLRHRGLDIQVLHPAQFLAGLL